MPKDQFAALLQRAQVSTRRIRAMSESIAEAVSRSRNRPSGRLRMRPQLRRPELRLIAGGLSNP